MSLHVERTGAGPALLLLHGWAMHGGIFAPLVDALAPHFCVTTIDLPGHGGSRDSPLPLELGAVTQALGEMIAAGERPLVLGWSLGGLAALAFAAAWPARLRGLVMLAASPRFVDAPDWPHGMDKAVFERFGEALACDWRGTLDRFLMLEAQGSPQLGHTLRFLRDAVHSRGEPAPRALQEGLRLLHDADLRAALPELAVPSLWLAGRRDRLVHPQAMQAAASLCPRGRFHCFERAGHAPFLTEPAAVAAALTAFARDCPP